MSKKVAVSSSKAPGAIGPYSQAIQKDGLLFTSGQIPLTSTGENLCGRPIAEQARLVLENLKAVLEASGATLDNVVKTTVFLVDLADFTAVNEVYASYFKEPFPARSTIGVAQLPKGAKLEIEAIVCL